MTLIDTTANEFTDLLHLEEAVGEPHDVTVQSVVIVAAVEGTDINGHPVSRVLTLSSDERRWVRAGLLTEALRGVQDAES